MTKEINMPDYGTWATNLIQSIIHHGRGAKSLEEALEQAFDQGYHLGLRDGDGQWWKEYDEQQADLDAWANEGGDNVF